MTDSKKREVQKLLSCGDFSRGFYKYECPDCKTSLILPFSCKSRLCLSCYRKKLFGWSVNLSNTLDSGFRHDHITFTIPGGLRKIMLERGFRPEVFSKLAALLFQREARKALNLTSSEWKAGILCTLHKSGNSLNYNPHVHMISTRELVNVSTGEYRMARFLSYKRFRFGWQSAVLRLLVRQNIISKDESQSIRIRYKNGFHVHFQPIAGTETDVLFRTAEYMATGFFHNSQILKLDHAKKQIIFRFRSRIDPGTRKKSFSTMTLDIYEFMARMLYYLPDHHQKIIRYYGLYATIYRKTRIEQNRRSCLWSSGIEHSFEKKPELCPDCGREMIFTIIFSSQARILYRAVRREYYLNEGYFRPIRPP